MTMKFKPAIIMTRERVAEIMHNQGFSPGHVSVFWREAQKLEAMPKKLIARKTRKAA